MLRRSEAQLHHGDQAHAARERLGAFSQQTQRLIQSLGRGIIERLGNHAFLPEASFQIFSGVIGISMCRTPSGESASTTKNTTADEAPKEPASPTPFTPSGFTGDGV